MAVVPQVVVNGSGEQKGAAGSSVMEGLLTLLLSEQAGDEGYRRAARAETRNGPAA